MPSTLPETQQLNVDGKAMGDNSESEPAESAGKANVNDSREEY
jgi:hypothetical protein